MEPETTVKELEDMIFDCFQKKGTYEVAKQVASAHYAEFEELKNKVIGTLENLGMSKYNSKSGLFSFKEVSTFKTPKGEEAREAFFAYLKEKEVFDGMVSVNSRTLNSWAHEEEANAEREGNFDFQIPGLEKTEPVMKASMRKAGN